MARNNYIRDLEGNLIEVTDLNEAIAQTASYICILYQQQEPSFQEFAKKRQRYWKDIFQKLGRLKAKLEAVELTQLSTDGFPSNKNNHEINSTIRQYGKGKAFARIISR